MKRDRFETVRAWHEAVNQGDADALVALSDDDIEVGGPRGSARGSAVLRDWLGRAGIRLEPQRWFATPAELVVEQIATWRSADGSVTEPETLASSFTVEDERVTRTVRYGSLEEALAVAGLTSQDEISGTAGETRASMNWKGLHLLGAEDISKSQETATSSCRSRPLKVGLILPDTEREMGGATARWSDLVGMARMAEDLGFDSIWNADHLIYRFPGKDVQGPWESWSLLAALAAVTSRIEIGPLVSCTSFRNPALLAKIADTVDEISGGRLVLGLGAGWHEPEYIAFGYPFDRRVSRFAEAIVIIHGLLRTGIVDFEGTYYSAPSCELRPRGPRPEGPPIMIGSTAPRMLGLLATYGDIWNAWARQSLDELAEDRQKVDAALEKAGRDPATVERTVSLLVDLPTATGRPSEEKPGLKPREPEELAAHLVSYADAGISHVQLMLDPNTPAGIEWAARSVEVLDG